MEVKEHNPTLVIKVLVWKLSFFPCVTVLVSLRPPVM